MKPIHVKDLNDIFEEMLGQTFVESQNDNSGCSMGRANSTWLCPDLVTRIVEEVLQLAGAEIVGQAVPVEDMKEEV